MAFWRNEYEIDEAAHEFLYETLAEAAEPQDLGLLTSIMISRECQLEENRIRNELSRGHIYDPGDAYTVGDKVVFPAYDFRLAEVTSRRDGENPEHGDFSVMTVRFENSDKERMFAAQLSTPHKLNRVGDSLQFGDEELLTPDVIFSEVGGEVSKVILGHLHSQPDYFINAGPLWLTADQMVRVNVGHLNIAEAAIEMKTVPVSTLELLELVEMDTSVSKAVRVFSLETAMLADERFAQVGSADASSWYLRRLMPDAAVETPKLLRYVPVDYDRSLLDVELLQTEWEINDEWTQGGLAEEVPAEVPSVQLRLTYPHLISGTLPLTAAARKIFPQGAGVTTRVLVVDGRWGSRFSAWVVHEGRYVAGLAEWYKQHKLPVGAQISVERGKHPEEVIIDFTPQRVKREWVRSVRVEEGRLAFEMKRKQVTCEFDDNLALWVDEDVDVADLHDRLVLEGATVEQVVASIMPELVKLSPQGTTHVKSLYSAVNTIMRVPPGPVFAALSQLPYATDTGSGYWSL